MKQVYCISGLGADERIFSKLSVPGVSFTHLKWLLPLKNESIEKYAARMVLQVNEDNPIFLGVSFGGMMSIEMAKLYPAAGVILVSSVKTRKELPKWMKLSGNLKLNRLIPPKPQAWMHLAEANFLGAETEEEIRLCNEFRKNVDPVYLHWAIEQVITWRNAWQPGVLHHLHGSKDKIFPSNKVAATHIIPGGGHFMIMNRAKEVSEVLARIIPL